MKKLAPWPAPGESRVHGPLSTDHMDEYIARVFRPRDPVDEELELKLEQLRLDQEKRMLLREVDQLKRDQAELEELKESLERLKEPEPEPEAAPESRPPRGRRPVLPGDMEILAALRLKRPSLSCRTDFYATLPKDIKKHRMAQRYRDADKGLRAANSPTAGK
jgi:hypothetical protein